MTQRICPTCQGEGVVEDEDVELDEDVDEDTGEPAVIPRTVVRFTPCPTCGGEGTVEE